MKKKIFKFSILFAIFLSLSQSALVYVFNHYLIIDFSTYEIPSQSLNLTNQNLYHLKHNLRLLHSILVFLLAIAFLFIHLFFFYIFRKEKFIFYSFFCFMLFIISVIACLYLEYIGQEESIFWYCIAFFSFIIYLIYLLFLDKFFKSHLFKIFFVFVFLCGVLTELKFMLMDFIMPFVLPTYFLILFILMRKKEF
ncbi:hypothetical protein [Campylobacter sp. US33a]|uniref:hypothetical protein n=1 Tax=Campylobacter sp. US33a TaxID=2498120 RepID=UPI001068087D|nr:hypothetical protein [Campylobacter sp. US33a]TEY04095.1 hypothetical protein ELQ16_02305 [Campylobacter sp. US33a]